MHIKRSARAWFWRVEIRWIGREGLERWIGNILYLRTILAKRRRKRRERNKEDEEERRKLRYPMQLIYQYRGSFCSPCCVFLHIVLVLGDKRCGSRCVGIGGR